jgi:hypothetical protein
MLYCNLEVHYSMAAAVGQLEDLCGSAASLSGGDQTGLVGCLRDVVVAGIPEG